jgi:hypothetical protein
VTLEESRFFLSSVQPTDKASTIAFSFSIKVMITSEIEAGALRTILETEQHLSGWTRTPHHQFGSASCIRYPFSEKI